MSLSDNGFEVSLAFTSSSPHAVYRLLLNVLIFSNELFSFYQLTLIGYNHKLRILLETVVEKIANFEVKPDRFAIIKVTMSGFRSLDNLS